MKKEFERYDLQTLLELYMKEAKDFSDALSGRTSWVDLKVKRLRIREISACISRKYQEQFSSSQRRRNAPPHGD
jgi:hypothetical protein